jgi:serine/threonine-protein kinase BUR1
VKREQERKDSEGEVKEVPEVKKRMPVRRSRKEEYEAYGRSFEGCGMQQDYDVTTKLGEGTFGSVYVFTSSSVVRLTSLPQRSAQSHPHFQSTRCRIETNPDA